jgi:hypothetical protein
MVRKKWLAKKVKKRTVAEQEKRTIAFANMTPSKPHPYQDYCRKKRGSILEELKKQNQLPESPTERLPVVSRALANSWNSSSEKAQLAEQKASQRASKPPLDHNPYAQHVRDSYHPTEIAIRSQNPGLEQKEIFAQVAKRIGQDWQAKKPKGSVGKSGSKKGRVKKSRVKKGGSKSGLAKRDSVKRDSVKRDSVKRDSVKRDSVKRDSVKRDSVKKGSAKKGSAKKGSAKKGSAKKGSAKKGSAKKGSAKKGSKGSAKKGGAKNGSVKKSSVKKKGDVRKKGSTKGSAKGLVKGSAKSSVTPSTKKSAKKGVKKHSAKKVNAKRGDKTGVSKQGSAKTSGGKKKNAKKVLPKRGSQQSDGKKQASGKLLSDSESDDRVSMYTSLGYLLETY